MPLAGCDKWDEFDATQSLRQVFQGFGNFDIFSAELDGKPFEGFTLRGSRTAKSWSGFSGLREAPLLVAAAGLGSDEGAYVRPWRRIVYATVV